MLVANSKVLITGGNGFLGSHIVKRFERQCADIFYPKSSEYDLVDYQSTIELLNRFKPDIIVHAAGFLGGIHFSRLYPADVFFKNLMMSCNILEASAKHGVKKLVNIGSACVYSDQLNGPFEEQDMLSLPMHPSVQFYGFSKQAQYYGADAYRQQYGLQSIHLVPANLYGPEDKFDPELSHVISSLIPKFYQAMKNGHSEVVCWGSGNTVREFVFVEDCADAVFLATESYESSGALNIGVGEGVTIKELAETIRSLVGFRGDIVWDRTKPDGASYKVLNAQKIKQNLGWSPSTSLHVGLEKTISWFAENYENWLEKYI